MDDDILKFIVQDGSIYCDETESQKDLSEKVTTLLKNDLNPFLNRDIISRLAHILSQILSKCYESNATSTEKAIEKPIIGLIQSWCHVSNIEGHNIYTPETLKVLLNRIENLFDNNTLSASDLRLFRNVLDSNFIRDNNTIEETYNKSLEMLNLKQAREKVAYEFISRDFEDKLLQPPMIKHLNYDNCVKISQVIENKNCSNQNIKETINLGCALINIKYLPGVRETIGLICNFLFRTCIDLATAKDFFLNIFGDENIISKDMELVFWENVHSLIEKYILEVTLKTVSEVKLSENIDYNEQSQFLELKSSVYNIIKIDDVLEIFKKSASSKRLFQTISLILNQLLISTNFDFRILALIENFIDVVNSCIKFSKNNNSISFRIQDLYPNDYRDILFYIDFTPEISMVVENYDKTLEKIFECYLESPMMCLLILNHFNKWIPCFHSYFANV